MNRTLNAMQDAAQQMDNGNLMRAAAHQDQAVQNLDKMAQRLRGKEQDGLEQAVEAVQDEGQQVADTQRKIRAGIDKVLADARERNKAGDGKQDGKQNETPALNAADLQKLKGLAHWQLENQKRRGKKGCCRRSGQGHQDGGAAGADSEHGHRRREHGAQRRR
jgi:hypothetical protein